jgi:protein SCO1
MTNPQTPPNPNTTTYMFAGVLVATVVFAIGLFVVRGGIFGGAASAVTVTSGAVATADANTYTGTPIDPPLAIADFTLTDQHGEPFRFSQLRGQAVLMFFGFTHCPDFCPNSMFEYTLIKRALGEQASNVAFVFVTVDGSRDTPAVLARFMRNYDTTFIALTGDEATVMEIGRPFNIVAEREPLTDGGYTIDHTVATFLFNTQGEWVRRFSYGTATEVIATQVAALIGE